MHSWDLARIDRILETPVSILVFGEKNLCEHKNVHHKYPRKKIFGFISRRIDTCKDCGRRLRGKWWIGAKTVKRKRVPDQQAGERNTR